MLSLKEIFCLFVFSLLAPYLRHDIDGTHQQLIQMSVHHDVRAMHQGVLKTRPDLFPQLIRYIEFDTEISQANTS